MALDQYHDQEPITNKRGRKRKLAQPEPEISTVPEVSVIRDAGEPAVPIHSIDNLLPDNLSANNSLMPPPATPGFPDLSGSLVMPSLGMTPGGLLHGSLTPGSLHHGGMTPSHLDHGGMTPLNLQHGGMTPLNLPHGGLTPTGLQHGDFSSGDLHHSAFTPAGLDHGGGMTPHHGIENLESIPNLPADQVSSILNGTGMENLGFSNMGYDENATPRGGGMSERVNSDWNDDYDFPPSVGAHVSSFLFTMFHKQIEIFNKIKKKSLLATW